MSVHGKSGSSGSARLRVLVAIALVAGLGALLAARLLSEGAARRSSGSSAAAGERSALGAVRPVAPSARVPEPRPVELSALALPCWICAEAKEWPIDFRTDLDLLAPLGDGVGNAAEFFVAFRAEGGPRRAELEAANARRVTAVGKLGQVLPPDDPLLLEAEPWCDQASFRIYPDLLELDGWATPVPDLMFALTLARSWVARGLAQVDPDAALADLRRTIRLGRLLRQDGTVVVADLVGLAVVRIGAQGLFEHAQRTGDRELALLASIVHGEAAGQRTRTSERITRLDLGSFVRGGWWRPTSLDVPGGRVDEIAALAAGDGEARFRGEAILALQLVRGRGASAQRERAERTLEALAAGDDPKLARLARWSLDHDPTAEQLEELARAHREPTR